MKKYFKRTIEKLPYFVTFPLKYLPFHLRLGREYSQSMISIEQFLDGSSSWKKLLLLEKIKNVVEYAYNYIPFYREFYDENGFNPSHLTSFEDINKIPILSKNILMDYGIEKRSFNLEGRILTNTGGTSGQPLSFYTEPNPYSREWSHMHSIWAKLGYRPTDIKLTFRGVNIGDSALKYGVNQNEYLVNAYYDFGITTAAIRELIKKQKISYLHGYPSLIYEFSSYCAQHAPDLIVELSKTLKGIFFGSEYPAPVYRDLIEDVWKVPTVSWYGHSERVILAYERTRPFCYEPMHTYGFCEAVPAVDGNYSLVGTCFDNFASPFIRYDTGDIIANPEYESGILQSFQISEGRKGEFIADKKGHPISLTALIFGRHHKIFGVAKFIQVLQERPGTATILVTSDQGGLGPGLQFADLFDSSNVDIDFNFKMIKSPIRTPIGKVPLLVNNLEGK